MTENYFKNSTNEELTAQYNQYLDWCHTGILPDGQLKRTVDQITEEYGPEYGTKLMELDYLRECTKRFTDIVSHPWIAMIMSFQNSGKNEHRFQCNDNGEILCKTEEDAMCIADFLEAVGFDVVHASENEEADTWRWEVYPD